MARKQDPADSKGFVKSGKSPRAAARAGEAKHQEENDKPREESANGSSTAASVDNGGQERPLNAEKDQKYGGAYEKALNSLHQI
jgi:hypothetical protein